MFKRLYEWFESLYRYSWLYNLRWYITHWYRKDHWVKTNLSIGYHDKSELMSRALFCLVEDFISRNGEDAFSIINWDGDECHRKTKENIIQILHFYRVRRPEIDNFIEKLSDDISEDSVMVTKPCLDKPGFMEIDFEYPGDLTKEQHLDVLHYIRRLEQMLYEETQEILKKCIDVRMYLWC